MIQVGTECKSRKHKRKINERFIEILVQSNLSYIINDILKQHIVQCFTISSVAPYRQSDEVAELLRKKMICKSKLSRYLLANILHFMFNSPISS